MLSTKVCELNNWIQNHLEGYVAHRISASEVMRYIPEEILNPETENVNLPLTRLMNSGKVLGSLKDRHGNWFVHHIEEYEEIASIQQIANFLGYKSINSLYDRVRDNSIPVSRTEKGEKYFVVNDVVSWAEQQSKLPFNRPRYSLNDIHDVLWELKYLLRDLNDFNLLVEREVENKQEDFLNPETFKEIEGRVQQIVTLLKERGRISFDLSLHPQED